MKLTTHIFAFILLCAFATFTGCKKEVAPTACFTASIDTVALETSIDTVALGFGITFTNCSAEATTYLWNFGDGDSSTLASPTHVYTTTGTFTVTLTAKNAHSQATKTATVVVRNCPSGYEGAKCTFETRKKYFGTYILAGTDNGTPAEPYSNLKTIVTTSSASAQNLLISIDGAITLQVQLDNAGGTFTVTGTTSSSFTYTGSGTFTGNVLTLTNLTETRTSNGAVVVYNLSGPKQ